MLTSTLTHRESHHTHSTLLSTKEKSTGGIITFQSPNPSHFIDTSIRVRTARTYQEQLEQVTSKSCSTYSSNHQKPTKIHKPARRSRASKPNQPEAILYTNNSY
jgi:hypothetical protein